MTKRRRFFKRLIIILLLGITALTGFIGYQAYLFIKKPIFYTEGAFLYVTNEDNLTTIVEKITKRAPYSSFSDFKQIAKHLNYGKVHPGKYNIDGLTKWQLLLALRNGTQIPVKISFHNLRLKEEIAGRLGEQLMIDSLAISELINDSLFCQTIGVTPTTITTLFIPNTYQVYWNISPQQLLKKMHHEYDRFWTKKREEKAENMGLSKVEISILASIVEEETKNKKEQSIVAGLYLNRLKKGMPLQACPTVKFALGDFSLTRILEEHLTVESPYNTYQNVGLPPGPIRIPSIQVINAVLNFQESTYLYMCAKPDFSGTHNFASSLRQHNYNASLYHQFLRKYRRQKRLQKK